jgi:putative two-component system response regulator
MEIMTNLVLLVDDSSAMHDLINAYLDETMIQTVSVFGGVAALEFVATRHPDLILLDVDMPDMNGFDVCRFLKSDPATREIPVIFLSALAAADERIVGLALQAVDYVAKPFDPEELRLRVLSALRVKRLLAALPKTSTPGEHSPHATNEPEPMNRRLELAQRMQARGNNPWSRQPPARVAVA